MGNSKDIVREYIERVWNEGDVRALDELTTSTFTYTLGGNPKRNRGEMRQFIEMIRVAFPDWRVQIVAIVSEKDVVVVQWEGRVTHKGVFHGIPPTNRQITVCGINIYHLKGDRIESEFEQMDSLGMLRQLGMLPGT